MAVTVISQPPEPALARTRQEWLIESSGHTALDRYRVKVVMPQPGSMPPFEIVQAPDENNRSRFVMSDCADAQLKNDLPAFGATAAAIDTGGAKRLTATLRESWYDVNGLEQTAETDISFWAVGAGLGHSYQGLSLDTLIFNGSRYMCYVGRNQPAPATGQQFLTWYYPATALINDFVLEVTRFYVDGTNDVFDGPAFQLDADNRLVTLPVGYAQLGVATGATAEVSGWGVQVKRTSTGAISERLDFNLSVRTPRRSFLFVNSAGGWQSLHCYGHWEQGHNFDRSTAEANRPTGHAPELAQFRTVRVADRKSLRSSSGWIPKGSEQMEVAMELCRSRRVFEVRESSFVPVVLTNSEVLTDKSLPDLLAVQFEYREAFQNEVHNQTMPA